MSDADVLYVEDTSRGGGGDNDLDSVNALAASR